MKRIGIFLLLTGGVLLYKPCDALSQDTDQKWTEYMTPSAMQQMMAGWDGEWEEEITMWAGPDAPSQEMKASCENKMILDGRYQQAKHEGSFMGMPFNGISITGYDNLRKVFVSSWIDNFGTGMIYMEGTWDDAAKAMTLTGKMTDPSTGGQTEIRQVLTILDKNNQVLDQYTVENGTPYKSMEIKLSRKK